MSPSDASDESQPVADPTVVPLPKRPTDYADGLNTAAQLGWALAEFENVAEELHGLIAHSSLAPGAKVRGVEEILRISSRLLSTDLVAAAHLRDENRLARRPVWDGVLGQLQGLFRWADLRSVSLVEGLGVRRASGRFAARWTIAGATLTLTLGVLLCLHLWTPALAVLLIRLAGSTIAGGPAVIRTTAAGVQDRTPALARSLLSCLTGHLADTLTAAALAMALLSAQRPGWALLLMGSGALAMYATMARVAAERSGVRITRSPLERVARNGSLLFAVSALALAGTAVIVPAAVTFAVGMGGYGLLELSRIAAVLSLEPSPREATTFALDSAGRIRIWALGGGVAGWAGLRSHSAA
jgi:hypothetical protein